MGAMWITAHDLDFAAIREEFELPPVGDDAFPAEVVAEATAATDRLPGGRDDRTDLALVTIDPPGSMDLDQALRIETAPGGGWRVFYAIADVGALVVPGGALEAESLARGQTIYLPDGSHPLHPRALSEGAGSLLPGEDRPAVLWTVDVDADGEAASTSVERALVRSRERLTYAEVQDAADAGTLAEPVAALPAVGRALRAAGSRAGAVNLRLPAQDIAFVGGRWNLRIEPRTEADEWNAQISLLVGRCAARIMLDGGAGILRTLPEAGPETIAGLRRTAAALRLDWPEATSLGVFLDGLDVNAPEGLAMMRASTAALRGADYAAFSGTPPEVTTHAGIGGAYAHVTAPLRRLVDRFATEICLALAAGEPVPGWVSDAAEGVTASMETSGRRASRVDLACVDLAEAVALEDEVGRIVEVYVLRGAAAPANGESGSRSGAGEIFLPHPPVFGPCSGPVEEGRFAHVEVVRADRATRAVAFAPAEGGGAAAGRDSRDDAPR